MTADHAAVARDWARQLPEEFGHRLARALRSGPDAVRMLRAATVLPASVAATQHALEIVAQGDGPYVAGMLSAFLNAQGGEPTVTPVWTGPDTPESTGRLTIAVLADLLSEAQHEILLASYAAYPSQEVLAALREAATRGVEILLLLERREDNPQFAGVDEPFPQLRAQRLHWPADKRPPGAAMHAKLLVIDKRVALVGSANLTGHGLERNMEAGLLVRGGPVPAALARHLLDLRDSGVLHS